MVPVDAHAARAGREIGADRGESVIKSDPAALRNGQKSLVLEKMDADSSGIVAAERDVSRTVKRMTTVGLGSRSINR